MGASCVLPSVASLTGRTVSIFIHSASKKPAPNSYLLMDTPYLKQVVVLSQQGMYYVLRHT